MRLFISVRLATNASVIILTLLLIFHLLILCRVISFGVVWGGKLKTVSEMVVFETVSIVVTLLMLATVCMAGGYLKTKFNPAIIKGILWAMSGLFLLNTMGNFLSMNRYEQVIFAPLTLLLSIFCMRLANVAKK